MDTSDAAAYALLERIARKAVEPMDASADQNKTLGAIREELLQVIVEAVDFVRARNCKE